MCLRYEVKFLAKYYLRAVGIQGGVNFGAVETDDDSATNINDRNTTLAAFSYRFFGKSRVGFNVFVGVGNVLFI